MTPYSSVLPCHHNRPFQPCNYFMSAQGDHWAIWPTVPTGLALPEAITQICQDQAHLGENCRAVLTILYNCGIYYCIEDYIGHTVTVATRAMEQYRIRARLVVPQV